ncbi:MAG: plasmid segregation centromere-binding protein ParR [Neglectibacter timonensis]|uniref:plasmid segregation centromere-binding protein ParR n=1 Tax=Neglectibacter timonensis TaxID=1776382 RepID=UPI0022E44114|nr:MULTISPECIES: plasmid segregation centromere-binding protein ParR [Lachnospiraceae]
MREVSRPVFSFRPTLDDSEHKRAWEILQSVPNGQKNAFLVQAILQSADSENLIEKIRMVFREELKGVQISPEKNMGKQEDGIPSQMLDFLSGMEENWE